MIVCSCNVFSDQQLRSALAKATQRLRMSQIYELPRLQRAVRSCAHTIKRIMEQVANRAIASVSREHEPAHENAEEIPAGKVPHRRSTSEPVGQRLNVMK